MRVSTPSTPHAVCQVLSLIMIDPRLLIIWMSSIIAFANGQVSNETMAEATVATNGNYTNTSSAVPYNPYTYYKIPPWGLSSFGYVDELGSHYRAASGFSDIVRSGWSWTPRERRNSAPFCYDSVPGRISTCFTGDVKRVCEENLGGMSAFQDKFCLSNQPFDVLGPVCWNSTCFAEETKIACEEINAFFLGDLEGPLYSEFTTGELFQGSAASWCVIPGGSHTIVGPACYGKECFTEDLAVGCQKMGGKNFADRFCLVDKAYKVIGPICTPTEGPIEEASTCYPEETQALCIEMNGISIGGIFCVVTGNYSVLGPFCTPHYSSNEPGQFFSNCASESDGEDACTKLGGRSIGKGMFCILSGSDYHLLGPLCSPGGSCWVYNDIAAGENNCEKDFAGTAVGPYSCIFKGDYTIVGPSDFGNVRFRGDNILADHMKESEIVTAIAGDNSWYVVNGTYSVIGPTCYGSDCHDGECIEAGGSRINSIFCIISDEQEAKGSSTTSQGTSTTSLCTEIGFYLLSASFALTFYPY